MRETIRYIERVTYLALLVTCVIASTVLVRNAFVSRNSAIGPKIGTRVAIPSLSWSAPNTYVVLAVSSQCRFCVESVPFYKTLSDWKQKNHSDLKLVVVSPEATGTTEEFLRSNRIIADTVVSYPLQSLGVSGTPTLMIVDSKGVLKGVHHGKLQPDEQADIIGDLKKTL